MIAKRARKKKIQNGGGTFFFPVFFGLVFLLISAFLAFSNWQMNQRRQQLLSRVGELEKEIVEAEKRNEELKSGIASVSREGYLEKEAREKFQLKKSGEKVVAVVLPEKSPEPVPKEQPKDFWEKILEKLGF